MNNNGFVPSLNNTMLALTQLHYKAFDCLIWKPLHQVGSHIGRW